MNRNLKNVYLKKIKTFRINNIFMINIQANTKQKILENFFSNNVKKIPNKNDNETLKYDSFL